MTSKCNCMINNRSKISEGILSFPENSIYLSILRLFDEDHLVLVQNRWAHLVDCPCLFLCLCWYLCLTEFPHIPLHLLIDCRRCRTAEGRGNRIPEIDEMSTFPFHFMSWRVEWLTESNKFRSKILNFWNLTSFLCIGKKCKSYYEIKKLVMRKN